MEKNQVILDLDEYNELRDIKENLRKGNIVAFVASRCGDRNMYFYTENEVVKQFATENADLEKRRSYLLLQLRESEAKFNELQNNIKIVMLENNRLENKIIELETKPAFSIRNFLFGDKKKKR